MSSFDRYNYCDDSHALTAAELRIDELEAENEDIANKLAEGVHTCSRTCKRPMCVLRRENRELQAENKRLREALSVANRRLERSHYIAAQAGIEKALAAIGEKDAERWENENGL